MILYFSATGNSKHVASRLAEAASDRAVSIEGLNPEIALVEGEMLGLVTPTYGWRIPAIVERFLGALQLSDARPAYAFAVSTYGTTPGASGPIVRRMLEQKVACGVQLFSVQMPDTWTPLFDLSDAEAVAEKNRTAETQIDEVCHAITQRAKSRRGRRQIPSAVIPIANAYYESMRNTAPFAVEDTCIGCGLCAKKCPDDAIEMRDGRPVWTAKKCDKCLRCLHSCPKFAIQHGPKTKQHGQYRHK